VLPVRDAFECLRAIMENGAHLDYTDEREDVT
jgi:hypothetical protein